MPATTNQEKITALQTKYDNGEISRVDYKEEVSKVEGRPSYKSLAGQARKAEKLNEVAALLAKLEQLKKELTL